LLLEIPIRNTAPFPNRIYISNQEKRNCNFSGEKESTPVARKKPQRHRLDEIYRRACWDIAGRGKTDGGIGHDAVLNPSVWRSCGCGEVQKGGGNIN
jgi:hypothetical protein